jgi:hypothetical protein
MKDISLDWRLRYGLHMLAKWHERQSLMAGEQGPPAPPLILQAPNWIRSLTSFSICPCRMHLMRTLNALLHRKHLLLLDVAPRQVVAIPPCSTFRQMGRVRPPQTQLEVDR